MAINPEDVGIEDQPELDPIFLREPENPKYQLMFPWGAGGNIVRHIIALHPGQEYLNIHATLVTDNDAKFRDLLNYQYPTTRSADAWLDVEWTTRHLYDESRITHYPPGSWHNLPTIIINPDRPEIVGVLYKIKNPGMNGWELADLIKHTEKFSKDIPNEEPLYENCMVLNFSDLISDFNSEWYHRIVEFVGLETNSEIEVMVSKVHAAWLRLQRELWGSYFK